MDMKAKIWLFSKKSWLNVTIILIIAGFLFGVLAFFELRISGVEAKLSGKNEVDGLDLLDQQNELVVTQENSLLPISNLPGSYPRVVRKIRVVITAYSSSIWETDSTPYLTAAGTLVREGIVANNLLALRTEIRIPELYGDKVFVVEDRMSWKKGYYHIDIWHSEYWQAKNFGAKRTYIEVLEN